MIRIQLGQLEVCGMTGAISHHQNRNLFSSGAARLGNTAATAGRTRIN